MSDKANCDNCHKEFEYDLSNVTCSKCGHFYCEGCSNNAYGDIYVIVYHMIGNIPDEICMILLSQYSKFMQNRNDYVLKIPCGFSDLCVNCEFK